MKILLTEEEVAKIIAEKYGVDISSVEWITKDTAHSFHGFMINADKAKLILDR